MRAPSAIVVAVLVGVALSSGACEADGGAERSEETNTPADPFKEGTGWFYHYVRATEDYPSTLYAAIEANIDSGFYTDRGVSNIMIYGPYRASEDFRGLPAIDYFGAQVGTGTVDDFRALVAAAHSKGITVTIYMALLSVHPTNEIFRKAEADVGNGVDSFETKLFRWSRGEPPRETPSDFPEYEGGWAFSPKAHRWYATSWGYPAFDYASPQTRDYVKGVLWFWLDTGIDGIEYDYPLSFLGMESDDLTIVDPTMVDVLITTPLTHSQEPTWLHAEGVGGFWDERWNDSVGFNHILINGDEDQWSFPWAVMDDGASERRKTVQQLETHWQRYFDRRGERNPDLGVNAWSLYVDMTPEQRALDAAVQAGMGALYSIDVEEIYSRLTVEEQTAYDSVFAALKLSPALAPGASREQRPASICEGGSSDQVYAIERTSTDGGRTVLNIYNFTDRPQCVTVDLSDGSIAVPQTPLDLTTQRDAARITSASYDVRLPAFGYQFLEVASGASGS